MNTTPPEHDPQRSIWFDLSGVRECALILSEASKRRTPEQQCHLGEILLRKSDRIEGLLREIENPIIDDAWSW